MHLLFNLLGSLFASGRKLLCQLFTFLTEFLHTSLLLLEFLITIVNLRKLVVYVVKLLKQFVNTAHVELLLQGIDEVKPAVHFIKLTWIEVGLFKLVGNLLTDVFQFDEC